METISIEAGDLRAADVWLGEDGIRLAVDQVSTSEWREFIPWGEGKTSTPVRMRAIRIEGTLYQEGYPDFEGSWVLQEDQPIEVERWDDRG